jgi:hypothetical protein
MRGISNLIRVNLITDCLGYPANRPGRITYGPQVGPSGRAHVPNMVLNT